MLSADDRALAPKAVLRLGSLDKRWAGRRYLRRVITPNGRSGSGDSSSAWRARPRWAGLGEAEPSAGSALRRRGALPP